MELQESLLARFYQLSSELDPLFFLFFVSFVFAYAGFGKEQISSVNVASSVYIS